MKDKERTRLYRVWHTDKKNLLESLNTKEIEEVRASSIKEAKKIVC